MVKLLHHHVLWFIIFIVGTSLSCSKENLAAKLPAYLYIPAFQLETDYAEGGTAHSNFTTAWVFYNTEPIGVFELPCTIPIIPKEGAVNLQVYPGINMNGISASRSIYSSCEPIEQNVTLTALDTFAFNPQIDSVLTTRYYDNATVTIVENFDGSGINLEPTSNSDSSVVLVSDMANTFNFPGENNGRSGLLALTENTTMVEVKSSDTYPLPRGKDVYVEITYKSNNSFLVGVIANETVPVPRSTLFVRSSKNEWKKIYVNIIGEVGLSPTGTDFNLLIGAIKDPDVTEAMIYLDNIKLVYR